METLKNYRLIFDDQCPLCQTYTKVFVKTGMLEESGREGYQTISEETCILLDRQRACNEIALVNLETQEVRYGLDSILFLVFNRLPFLKKIFDIRLIYVIFQHLYFFISYNRKQIMPSKSSEDTCQPTFRLPYRIAYLTFTWFVTSFILYRYSHFFDSYLGTSTFGREFLFCGGQILFQSLLYFKLGKVKLFNYLGNMMTISLAGALFLLIAMLGFHILHITEPFYPTLLFLTTALFMLFAHWSRCKKLKLNFWYSVSWVIYRIIILSILLTCI